MLTSLLVPIDGSDASKLALVYAGAIPSERVRLLTVLSDDLAAGMFASAATIEHWRSEWLTAVGAMLEEAAKPLREQGRIVEIAIVEGRPAELIEAHSADVDLVIMTTRGHGSGRRLLFGSVADRIARSSAAPVMLVRGGDDPVTVQPIVRLVVALDGSTLAEQSLSVASELATSLGVPVRLVRVVDLVQWSQVANLDASPVARYAATPETMLGAAREYLENQEAALAGMGVEVESAVLSGEPSATLNDSLLPGDILVLTSHGRSGLGRWMLGSVAEKLITQGRVPVIVVRAKPEHES
ncbi:MAG: universal stress protein [Thermomicrobiales bacterium]